ncbi:hypothetical protein HPP92_008937 [Vanilla planifolia]|uniref:Hflx-type G domain-containing protein n=1 Tax=Vanilla planifolia TaxID=51239 RepID=A0A835R6Z4_VANPL|nr:hypothetical protein HPP92_008937 [Vanilla planifolia]
MIRTLSRLRMPFRPLLHTVLPVLTLLSTRVVVKETSSSPCVERFSAPFSSTRRRKWGSEDGEEAQGEEAQGEEDTVPGVFVFGNKLQNPPRLFVVQPRFRPDSVLNSKLSEAVNLAKSLEEKRDGVFQLDLVSKEVPPHLVVQNPAIRSSKSHADTYFGPGTVENIKSHLKALESEVWIDAVFVNAVLSGIQQRNLEISWAKPVLDRIGLIIEIFNAHAETKEAKLQSELAALMYKRSRLVRVRGLQGRLTFGLGGEAEVVSGRGRGSGGRGFMSGAGETELQLQRRRIQERRNQLLVEIEEVRRTRSLQRYSRKRRGGSDGQGLATVAVVGYTNAGKSTLVSALSNSDLYRDDRLFATVDPRLRSVVLPSGKKILLSDTVGFISDLPVQLVEAFHATLEELVEADLLLHVLDSSASNVNEQRSSVLEVLKQIGVPEEKMQNMIEVWNKVDLLNQEQMAGKEEAEDLEEEEEQALVEETTELAEPLSKLQENASCKGSKFVVPSEEARHRVETSAIAGTGLKELLYLIDKKLNAQRHMVGKSFEPLNCKWRPHSMETDRAAEQ